MEPCETLSLSLSLAHTQAVHGELREQLRGAEHARSFRNLTRKKLRPDDCLEDPPRLRAGWSKAADKSRWWCPAARAPSP